jgi:hypothetical protein
MTPRSLHLTILALACTTKTSEPPVPDSGVSDEDTASDSGHDGSDDGGESPSPALEPLTCVAACGNLRLLVGSDTGSISIFLPIDMFAANTAGTPGTWSGTMETSEVKATWSESQDPGICSSIEEWPQSSTTTATFDTYQVEYVPLDAWNPAESEWSWDGTELGELSLLIGGLRLLSEGTTTAGPADLSCTLPFSKPELPAR